MPVTIRTLDPPLHEFLPTRPDEIAITAERLDMTPEAVAERVEELREANPMLGHRGCRLGMTVPEITEMQARAIFRAALRCAAEGIDVRPEIMIPLVSDVEELRRQRRLIDGVAVRAVRSGRPLGRVPDRDHDRAAPGGPARRRSGARGRLLQLRHQRPDPDAYGISRDDAGTFLPQYLTDGVYPHDPFQTLDTEGVGELVRIAAERGRSVKKDLELGVCGEHGGDPESIRFCHEVGLDYVSCSPFRVPVARLAAAHAAMGMEAAVVV